MLTKNIVLIHGWGANIKKLAPLSQSLKKKGWNVFIPKLPGFDLSPPETIWGIGEYAEYVWNKTQQHFASKKFFLFGHSFGGRIVIKLARKHPKELPGIVLCATGGISRPDPIKRNIFFLLAKLGKIFATLPALGQFWQTILYKLAREHDYEKARGVMRDVFKKIIRENSLLDIQKIQVPTLVLWGRDDRVTKVKDVYKIKEKVKSAKMFIFPNEGHRLPYHQPDRVAEQIIIWARKIR